MSWKLYFFAFALVLASLLLSLFAVEHSAYVTPPFVGLILSSIIVLLFSKTRYRLFPARAQGVWGAIVLLLSAIAFLAPFGILFQLGLVSFTYADGGLEPTYFSSITLWNVRKIALRPKSQSWLFNKKYPKLKNHKFKEINFYLII